MSDIVKWLIGQRLASVITALWSLFFLCLSIFYLIFLAPAIKKNHNQKIQWQTLLERQQQINSIDQQEIARDIADLEQYIASYQSFDSMADFIGGLSQEIEDSHLAIEKVQPFNDGKVLQLEWRLRGGYRVLLQWLHKIQQNNRALVVNNWQFKSINDSAEVVLQIKLSALRLPYNSAELPLSNANTATYFVPHNIFESPRQVSKIATKYRPSNKVNRPKTATQQKLEWQLVGVILINSSYKAVIRDKSGRILTVQVGTTFGDSKYRIEKIEEHSIVVRSIKIKEKKWILQLKN